MVKHSKKDLENIEKMKDWIRKNGNIIKDAENISPVTMSFWVNDTLSKYGYEPIPIVWLIDFIAEECFDGKWEKEKEE